MTVERDTDALLAADRRARALAQTVFDRPLVIEAGAGTGKTATLVARVLAWSLGTGWTKSEGALRDRPPDIEDPDRDFEARVAARVLRRVVAITFTEAAAAEMATRIAAGLAMVRDGSSPPGFEHLDPDRGEQRAAYLLAAADQLQVLTIHGFCRRLLATFPFEAGLHPAFAVDADGERLRAVVEDEVGAILPEAYGGDETAESEKDDPPRRLERGGSEAFLELAGAGIGPPQLADAVERLVGGGVTADDLRHDPADDAGRHALVTRIAEAAEAVLVPIERRLAGQRRAKNARALMRGLRRLAVDLDPDLRPPPSLAAIRDAVARALPDPLRQHLAGWARDRFNHTESDGLGGDRLPLVRDADRLHRLARHVVALDPETLIHARRALAPLLTAVAERTHAEGIVGFGDLLRLAHRLLEAHPPVRTRLRGRIDQLLVDEFQDTDDVQCRIVGRLALDGPVEQRPGLFVVGDPKQSIYGWRNADLEAYESLVHAVESAGGERLPLVENFRSVPAILDEVERVVAPVMIRTPGLQPAFAPLVACEARRDSAGAGPAVEHWVSLPSRSLDPGERGGSQAASALEARALVRDLRARREAGLSWGDVALLVRAATDVEVYLSALRDADIPFAVRRDRQYFRRREILDAASLVRTVLSPSDLLATLAFLRSSAVGLPDAALLPLWRAGFPAALARLDHPDPAALEALDGIIDRASRTMPTDIPGLAGLHGWDLALRDAIRALAELRRDADVLPADMLVARMRDRILLEVSEGNRYLGAYRQANLAAFFAQLESDLEAARGDRHAVLRALRHRTREGVEAEEATPADDRDDAVQVLTIHRAKGLQFDHVYLLQTHKAAGARVRPLVDLGHTAADDGGTLEYRVFGAATPAFDRVEARRDAIAHAELVRTLYVATTRAADRLVIAGNRRLDTRDMERATTHGDLLDHRRGTPDVDPPNLPGLFAEAAAGRPRFEAAGALWRLPIFEDVEEADDERAPLHVDDTGPSPSQVAHEAAALAERRRQSAERMARPLRRAASAKPDRQQADEEPPARDPDDQATAFRSSSDFPRRPVSSAGGVGEPAPGTALQHTPAVLDRHRPSSALPLAVDDSKPDDPELDDRRRLAVAVGTLVHHAFEHLDLAKPVAEGLPEQQARLTEVARVVVGEDDRDAAVARADEILAGFAESALGRRFEGLRDNVVARELPVLLPPDPNDHTGPVGFIAGTIDLVLRDDDGTYRIVDYKTDPIATEHAETHAQNYAHQCALYARALQEALGLENTPPVELWFLIGDRAVVSTIGAPSGRSPQVS